MDSNLITLLDLRKKFFKPLDREVFAQPSLDHDLARARSRCLLDPCEDLRHRQQVGVGAFGLAEKGAEAAAVEADVGVVDVPVDDEGDIAPRMPRGPGHSRSLCEREEVAPAD